MFRKEILSSKVCKKNKNATSKIIISHCAILWALSISRPQLGWSPIGTAYLMKNLQLTTAVVVCHAHTILWHLLTQVLSWLEFHLNGNPRLFLVLKLSILGLKSRTILVLWLIQKTRFLVYWVFAPHLPACILSCNKKKHCRPYLHFFI